MSRAPLRVENKKTVLKQVEQPRMGRPPNREVYATWLNATLELAAAIKLGSGGKSNKAIEETASRIMAIVQKNKETYGDKY